MVWLSSWERGLGFNKYNNYEYIVPPISKVS
jgi:hypothetical protein